MTALTPTDAATIPADIDRIATDLVCADYSVGDDDPQWKMYVAIASAILAERERCAQIAETCTVKSDWASEIAAAIRNPNSLLPQAPFLPSSESPEGETPLPLSGEPIESEGPKSRPGDAAASLTQQSNSPRQERPSAQERSSDRSGGQFGDAPKPAHIPSEVA